MGNPSSPSDRLATACRSAMSLVLPARKTLTLEAARVAMSACEAQAQQGGWRVVIAR